jgi:hypothetical protein
MGGASWKRVSVKKLSARKRGLFVDKKSSVFVDSVAEEEKSVEDLYAEMDRAIESGVCPECGCVSKYFENEDEKGLQCAECGWSFSFWGVCRDLFPK